MQQYITAWRLNPMNSRPTISSSYKELYNGQSDEEIRSIVLGWHDEDQTITGYSIEVEGIGWTVPNGYYEEVVS